MIDMKSDEFSNLQPWQRSHYRAASNFITRAEGVVDTSERIRLLREAIGHLREVGDANRAETVEKQILNF